MEKDKLEGNKLIQVFMGLPTKKNAPLFKGGFEERDWVFNYHSDWNLLIGVVERVEWLDTGKDVFDCRVTIERQECRIYYHSEQNKYEWLIGGHPKIESVWLSVIRFIQWLNQQNQ